MRPSSDAVTLPPLDFRADVGAINEDARTVSLIWSTGAEVLRYDWETGGKFWERLSLEPRHAKMGRLNGGAPLLNSHSAYTLAHQIGVVERASLENGKGTADVRFSKRADVEPFYQDVKDKIIRNVSVGYRVNRFRELDETKDGIAVRLAIDWEPFEVSLVPMGADAGAKVRSLKDVETYRCVIERAGVDHRWDADRRRRDLQFIAASV